MLVLSLFVFGVTSGLQQPYFVWHAGRSAVITAFGSALTGDRSVNKGATTVRGYL